MPTSAPAGGGHQVLPDRGHGEHGLPEEFVMDVFNAIHEASVDVQNEIISGNRSE